MEEVIRVEGRGDPSASPFSVNSQGLGGWRQVCKGAEFQPGRTGWYLPYNYHLDNQECFLETWGAEFAKPECCVNCGTQRRDI